MTPDDLIAMYASGPDPPALQGLSDVDWSAVSHAHGPATDVPAMLRALVSDDPDHRQFALEDLFETIWYQGTVFSATALVVPFLYRLLEADEVPITLRQSSAPWRSSWTCCSRTSAILRRTSV